MSLLFLYAVRTVQQYWALSEFKGPWVAGFSRLWLLRANGSGKMNFAFTAVNDKYVSPNMLITTDPELYKRMHAVRSPFVRSEWYTALRLHPTRDNITSVIDEGVHADLRNRMSTGYSGKENLHMENDVDYRLLQLFDLIDSKYVSSEKEYRPVDISRLYSYFTLDVISSIAFGQEFGFLKHDDDPFGYIDNLQEFLPAIIVFGAYPELQKILRLPLLKHVMPKSTDKRGLGRVMGFAKERVDERFGEKPVVRHDMLGSFIKRGLTQEQLESETLTQITAGSDSTASAIRMTMHFIATTPHVHSRLVQEFKNAMAAGKISRPVVRDVEARALPYLQACIKEGLRMYPPVTGLLAKAVPPEGVTIDGKFVKGGTQIAWNSWGMQRDKEIYGVDPEIFRPERWLLRDASETEKKRVDRMSETVGLTLVRYELQPASLSKPFVERCVGFFLHTDMMFRITRRPDADSAEANGVHTSYGDVTALPGAPDS
ncbi:unnamed protein product, partial [Aureobasidium uvarum]